MVRDEGGRRLTRTTDPRRPRAAERLGLTLLQGGAAALAHHVRFVQDDAFISFHYARNLVEGAGLTWFGERVEGYTNFLWVLWSAAGMSAGFEAANWANWTSLVAFVIAIEAVFRLGRRAFPSPIVSWVATVAFATHWSALAYATGGLETMLQTALLTVAALQVLALRDAGATSGRRLAALSATLGAAVLTRPDSALPAALWGLAVAASLGRDRRRLAALILPGLTPLVAWVAWKLVYYGSILPHPFHAKVGGLHANGLLYLGRYLHAYWLWGVIAAAILATVIRRGPTPTGPKSLWAALLAWWIYVVVVGGDFMEFRFFVPLAPVLFVLLTGHVVGLVQTPRAQRAMAAALGALLLAASAHHGATFRGSTADDALDSVEALGTFYGAYPDGDFQPIGLALARDLGKSDVLLATHASGAIPYYSRVRTLDMYGLNDPDVVRNGRSLGPERFRPGHRVHATLDLLRRRRAHLVVGHPQPVRDDLFANPDPRAAALLRQALRAMVVGHEGPTGQATALAMPLDKGVGLLMWYLTPHPAIDALVASGRWTSRPL